jgi:hypothetical protein
MTLYHYVRTKDDLWALMGDRMMGELLVPDDEFPADDWRAALGAIGRRSRAVFRRHPWMVSAMERAGGIGPNGMRHFEQSLAAVASTGLDPVERKQVIALVDDFVYGHALATAIEQVEMRDPEWRRQVEGYVEAQLATGDYPHIQRLVGDGDRQAAWERLVKAAGEHDRFDAGLEALLDGIEQRIARRT